MQKPKCLFAIAFLALLFQGTAFGQRTVKGVVNDAQGAPLIGVTVLEEGTTNGTVTSIDGAYEMEVAGDAAVLVFSYVGLKTVVRPVGTDQVIDIVMEEEIGLLGEIVVTALGLQENKDVLGYASSNVGGQAITGSGESTLLGSLSGESSGVRFPPFPATPAQALTSRSGDFRRSPATTSR